MLRTWVFFQILSAMARRPRSSTAWHFVLSAARRDADARAVALAGSTNWGYDSDGQVGASGGGEHGWTKGLRHPRRWALLESGLKGKDAPEGRGRAFLSPGCTVSARLIVLVKDPYGSRDDRTQGRCCVLLCPLHFVSLFNRSFSVPLACFPKVAIANLLYVLLPGQTWI